MNVNMRALIGKLNQEARTTVDAAAGLCMSRTHYDVEVEHYLMKLLDLAGSDFTAIINHYGIDRARLAKDLTASLDSLKTGNARTPSLSPTLITMLKEAWALGSVDFGAGRIRTGFTVLALVSNDELARLIRSISKELEKISAEDLHSSLISILAGSKEEAGAAPAAPTERGPGGEGKTPNLDQYTVDLTGRARAGELDPVLGRDFEIRQVVDILTRRRQNNPILVGEAGVGKTAVVEGFAMRIASGDVPSVLRNVDLRTLDLALLQAGAGIKGEFENRLKGLIEEVRSSETPIILFIDEAHTMIGAGGQAGQGDAANLLKPALARGELRTIAATTWSEYKKYFEKDPALTRRFQLVKVEEPDEETCLVMMRGVAPHLEQHHNVRILDDGVDAAVRLSHRYLPDRQLPDKSVSVLDTACARLALGQAATPAAVEDARRQLDDLSVQTRVLKREEATGADHGERLEAIAEERERVQARLEALEERWKRERELVERARDLRRRLEASVDGAHDPGPSPEEEEPLASPADEAPAEEGAEEGGPVPEGESSDEAEEAASADGANEEEDPEALRAKLAEVNTALEAVQGETALVPVCVDGELIAEVISGWTGVPVGKMHRDDISTALTLEVRLGQRIIGQDHALEVISHRIRTSRAGIEDPSKPVGVFLLVGPSGVGKTETALAMSDLLYGGEHNVVTINMSEFQEAHTVSTLKGSPPGYVGYGEGGVLTEAVRRRPYSVVLLDEIEKAHPDVLELFYQVFDKGRMEDGEGREIDFKNTVIVLTSNAGTDMIMSLTSDPETAPAPEGMVQALKPELNKIFKPAFLGRTVIVPYLPIRDEALLGIIRLKVNKVRQRLHEAHRLSLELDDRAVDAIADRCTEVESGARNIDNILTNTMLPAISRLLLQALAEDVALTGIRVDVSETGDFTYAAVTPEGVATLDAARSSDALVSA